MMKPLKKKLLQNRPKLRSRLFLLSCVLVVSSISLVTFYNQHSDSFIEQSHSSQTPQNTYTPEPTQNTFKPAPTHRETNEKSQIAQKDASEGSQQQAIIETPVSESKLAIDKSYETEIKQLRSKCRASSNHLLQQMVAELKSTEDATIRTLQIKFLGQLLKAESSCDSAFQSLIERASTDYQEAGIPITSMPSWKSQYHKEKAAVRASAITELAAAIK
jgi:hypothetical protein